MQHKRPANATRGFHDQKAHFALDIDFLLLVGESVIFFESPKLHANFAQSAGDVGFRSELPK